MLAELHSFLSSIPAVSLLLISLPVTALSIWLAPSRESARNIALSGAVFDLLLTLLMALGFDNTQAGYQFIEQYSWIASLQIQYKVGVDGISILFLPLTVMLFIGVILASWNSIRKMSKLYYTLLLLLESATLGIFCSLDVMLFFLFWELTLIPLYFLVSLWGIGPHRRYAAVKYTLFMLLGGIPLLFGFLLLAFNSAEAHALPIPQGLMFDYTVLLETSLPHDTEVIVFFLLLLGFAVKTPLFPFHTWLPIMAQEGPLPVLAYITGLKLGAYGLLRFAVPLAPNAATEYHWLLAGLGVFGVVYGALVALSQTNLRRMLAYFSISHIGFVVLGISSFNLHGIQGALFQLMNFILIGGSLFLLAGFLHRRVGSTELVHLGGVAVTMPRLATLFFLFGLASTGLPGTSGFPAEFLIIFSALETHTGAGLAALAGIVIGVACFFVAYRRAFLGPVKSAPVSQAIDLHKRELVILIPSLLLVVIAGIFPQWIIDFMHHSSEAWIARLP